MADLRASVFRADEAAPPAGPPTPGMDRRQLVAQAGVWMGFVRTEPGLAGGWHHHGDHDSYIYMIRGEMRIDFGPGGGESVTARAGDVIVNPARMVHREVTPAGVAVEAIVVRIGNGPPNVNVDGPDAPA